MSINENDVDVKKITIIYSDGTSKTINKGAVIEQNETDGEIKLNMEFCKFSGNDLINMIYGILEFASNTGMLDGKDESNDNEL
ncbi:hypothetical protein [Clostridium hydrogenum]|uniref:hypothetical protein n=1 Tax=Clostridium hydrogenum TaxID=2855764 RepID=UPI001F47C5C8|nr:hypothetical protein [Clostridium hydrogenum]